MAGIETYFHAGPGYEPLLIREGWQVAQLNFAPELAAREIRRLERHVETDEVFLLVRGGSQLISARETPGALEFEVHPMAVGLTYNVPAGAWHAIAMQPGDQVAIVERAQTHLRDVEYRDLTQREYGELQLALERGD